MFMYIVDFKYLTFLYFDKYINMAGGKRIIIFVCQALSI